MIVYYRFSGVVACLALVLNVLLIVAIMISIKAAFTLPGLAGLVLGIGMAVDANVLIYERMREEMARGAALRMAIRNGFDRATTTIVDSNLTTLISATVLYVIGTDQIKGFAVTLWLGVVLNMFTAIFCSRVVFDIAEKRRWITELKMMQILPRPQHRFSRLAAAGHRSGRSWSLRSGLSPWYCAAAACWTSTSPGASRCRSSSPNRSAARKSFATSSPICPIWP